MCSENLRQKNKFRLYYVTNGAVVSNGDNSQNAANYLKKKKAETN